MQRAGQTEKELQALTLKEGGQHAENGGSRQGDADDRHEGFEWPSRGELAKSDTSKRGRVAALIPSKRRKEQVEAPDPGRRPELMQTKAPRVSKDTEEGIGCGDTTGSLGYAEVRPGDEEPCTALHVS